jgi:hypothetical protein
MIFENAKTIFLHVPKTAGNAIQNQLIRFSDDIKDISSHQDGVDRFDVKGRVTPKKHAKLQDYADRMDISGYKVAITCRNPFDRLISFYFSPHRWQVEEGGGWKAKTPYWDRDIFRSILPTAKPIVEYLTVNQSVVSPDIVIRFEDIEAGYLKLGTMVAGSAPVPRLNSVNATFASQEEIKRAMNDPLTLETAVELFRADYEMFGYEIPNH